MTYVCVPLTAENHQSYAEELEGPTEAQPEITSAPSDEPENHDIRIGECHSKFRELLCCRVVKFYGRQEF